MSCWLSPIYFWIEPTFQGVSSSIEAPFPEPLPWGHTAGYPWCRIEGRGKSGQLDPLGGDHGRRLQCWAMLKTAASKTTE